MAAAVTAGDENVEVRKLSAGVLVPSVWLDEMRGFSDLIDDALRRSLAGEEGVFRAPTAATYHRCLVCWLVSLLPGHDRCGHGRLSCDDCRDG